MKDINFNKLDKIELEIKKLKKKKKFNKTKWLLISAISILSILLIFCFTIAIMILFGVGNGLNWATDIIKEMIRHIIPTALSVVSLIIGFLVGSSKENKTK